jgi:hypothetical protein
VFAAILVATALLGSAVDRRNVGWAAGACALIPSERDPSAKTLRCGQDLAVQAAPGTRYRPFHKKGQPLPVGVRLEGGALLVEFHPSAGQSDFQILTPLAIAAVRGTKWAMEVSPARTSTLLLDGSVAVTNRRLNEYVVLAPGQGVDISPSDTTLAQ